jgi:NADPH:quinone reductase-like Zn-dependent oxidoreductase
VVFPFTSTGPEGFEHISEEEYKQMLGAIYDGKIQPVIDRTFSLEENLASSKGLQLLLRL